VTKTSNIVVALGWGLPKNIETTSYANAVGGNKAWKFHNVYPQRVRGEILIFADDENSTECAIEAWGHDAHFDSVQT